MIVHGGSQVCFSHRVLSYAEVMWNNIAIVEFVHIFKPQIDLGLSVRLRLEYLGWYEFI